MCDEALSKNLYPLDLCLYNFCNVDSFFIGTVTLCFQIFRRIQQQAGFIEFSMQNFDEASELLKNGQVDIREVVTNEPSLDKKKQVLGLTTRSDTNRPVHSLMQAKRLKFWNREEEGLYYLCSENKGAAQLICAFGFAYADCWFTNAAAH